MIQFKKISKAYKNREVVLSDISIDFRCPSFNIITGKSGSGKTTLLNIIGGLDNFDKGELFFNGIKITKSKIDKYRSENVSFVFQQINLINSLSIGENLKLVFDMYHKKMDDDTLCKLFKEVGLLEDIKSLKNFLKKRPNQLSVGQSQRIAIVRALIKHPKVLILDEPTSALDEENSKGIVTLLKELSRKIIVIIATHDENYFLELADQILEIKDSKVIVKKKDDKEEIKDKESRDPNGGFLSFFETLKFALSNLKHKKIRLFTSFILSTLTIILLGLAVAFKTCDTTKVLLQTQLSKNEKISFVINNLVYHDHNSYLEQTREESFTDAQVKLMQEYTTNNAFPTVFLDSFFYRLIDNTNIKINTDAQWFFREKSKGIEIESSKLNEIGLIRCSKLAEETSCRMPESYDEIAINSMIAECILKYGFVKEVNEFNSVTKVFVPNKIDEIIGQQTVDGFTIVGIYSSTDGTEEYFEPYLFEDPEFKSKKEAGYFNKMRNGDSVSQYAYLKPGYSKTIKNQNSYTNSSTYCLKLKGNINSDYKFLTSLQTKNHRILLGNKYTSFTSILTIFSGYFNIIAWTVIVILILVSLIVSLSLFYANIKSMERDLGILKSIGVSKLSISFIVIIQTFFVTFIEFLIS